MCAFRSEYVQGRQFPLSASRSDVMRVLCVTRNGRGDSSSSSSRAFNFTDAPFQPAVQCKFAHLAHQFLITSASDGLIFACAKNSKYFRLFFSAQQFLWTRESRAALICIRRIRQATHRQCVLRSSQLHALLELRRFF